MLKGQLSCFYLFPGSSCESNKVIFCVTSANMNKKGHTSKLNVNVHNGRLSWTSCCLTSLLHLNLILFSDLSFCSQAAETTNKELEGRIEGLQLDMEESQQKQGNMKGELKKFMDILDGKIDELHEFRQGLSKLGVDN